MFKAIDQTLETEDAETLDSISKVAELAGHCTAREPFQRYDMGHAVNVLGPLVEQWKPSRPEEEGGYGIPKSTDIKEMRMQKFDAQQSLSLVDDLLFVLRDLCDTGKEFDVTVIERGIVSVGERNSIAGVLNGDIVCLRVTILRLPTDNSELMQKIGLILYVFKCRKEELKLLLFYSNRLELDNCVLVVRRGASGRMRLQSVSSRRDVRGRSDTSD
ncbi:hypothetical protein Tco_1368208 [Tanacetum coccineum]